mmetsp:Transcript_135655/g.338431  ORF Transcript_135655/g.338431 Transcript_135655/m.338431 type:complete len:592 (-) Transcript_135655:101-1876(-)
MASACRDGARQAVAGRLPRFVLTVCVLPALASKHAEGCPGGLDTSVAESSAEAVLTSGCRSQAPGVERDGDRLSLLQSALRVEQRHLLLQSANVSLSHTAGPKNETESNNELHVSVGPGGYAGSRTEYEMDMASVAYILVCTALVQLMTPGVAFFYGGLMRSTSILALMMQIYMSMGITTLLWYLVVFSLCFGNSLAGLIGSPLTYGLLQNMSHIIPAVQGGMSVALDSEIPGLLFVAYQGMFATLAPVVLTGAFADRFRFKPYLLFLCLWPVFVYAPWCHWVWGGGFLMKWGVYDFAGGIVVHTTGGFSALASLFVVGNRPERMSKDLPHNVPFVALGTALLWFGWLGFNSGSVLSTGAVAVLASANSEIAASMGLFTWTMIDWFFIGRPNIIGACIGAMAGLSIITPTAGYVQPPTALGLGAIASVFCYMCTTALKRLNFDDAFDVWGVHGMGGFLGAILLGAVADSQECLTQDIARDWCANPGTVARSWEQLGKQTCATCACAVYSFVVTWIILKAIDTCMPLKPDEDVMDIGLDLHEHGQQAYSTRVASKVGDLSKGGARYYVRRMRREMPLTTASSASPQSADSIQ